MKNKKGRQVMDFLLTYGWVMLVILVAIGALAYFGIFNPEKYTHKFNDTETQEITNQICLKYCNELENMELDFCMPIDEERVKIGCYTIKDGPCEELENNITECVKIIDIKNVTLTKIYLLNI